MAPMTDIMTGKKSSRPEAEGRFADSSMDEVERVIARYLEHMLTQLEAVARLVKIDRLANSLGTVRQEARDLVRQLDETA